MHEEIIPTTIPHAKFGAPSCGGKLFGRIVLGSTGGIICDKCFRIVEMLPPGGLRETLGKMADAGGERPS
jgi:hypothetical protein